MSKQSSLALVFLLFALGSPRAEALPVLDVKIQPIQICVGGTCTNPSLELFAAAAQKIWAQADIVIKFLPFQQISLSAAPAVGTDPERQTFFSSTDNGESTDSHTISMWFADNTGANGAGDRIGGSNIIIDTNVIAQQLIDVIAHELGHSLGLDHTFNANELMCCKPLMHRNRPASLADIAPNGSMSQISYNYIQDARRSPYLFVSEPPTLGLSLVGLLLVALLRGKSVANAGRAIATSR